MKRRYLEAQVNSYYKGSHPLGITGCSSYIPEEVRRALLRLLEICGLPEQIHPGMTVGIKANLIAAKEPSAAATTSPVVLSELTRILKSFGAVVIVGDSPGGAYNQSHLDAVYKKCGLGAVTAAGGRLNDDFSIKEAYAPEAEYLKKFTYTGWLDQADILINCCKLKTHAMMQMTCAVKNLFGTIPGTMKPQYHVRFPEHAAFANMLIDLNLYFRPVLTIVDAVDCMEGNGPTSGTPRHMGALLAGGNPFDLDAVCANLIGLSAKDVPTVYEANQRKLGAISPEELKITGDDPEKYRIADFQTDIRIMNPNFSVGEGALAHLIQSAADGLLGMRPKPDRKECIGCRKCRDVCPAKAIHMEKKKPVIDRKKCIRCFCCQEFCPVGAMKVYRAPVGRLMERMGARGQS